MKISCKKCDWYDKALSENECLAAGETHLRKEHNIHIIPRLQDYSQLLEVFS